MKVIYSILISLIFTTTGMAATMESTITSKLKVGESSKDDVQKLLGEPQTKSISGDKEMWIYEKNSQTIMIDFDAFEFVEEVDVK